MRPLESKRVPIHKHLSCVLGASQPLAVIGVIVPAVRPASTTQPATVARQNCRMEISLRHVGREDFKRGPPWVVFHAGVARVVLPEARLAAPQHIGPALKKSSIGLAVCRVRAHDAFNTGAPARHGISVAQILQENQSARATSTQALCFCLEASGVVEHSPAPERVAGSYNEDSHEAPQCGLVRGRAALSRCSASTY